MVAAPNWIRLRGHTRPVDGLNMDRVAAFIADGPYGDVLLYLGGTPEGKTPWLRLQEEDARAVRHWLAERGLVAALEENGRRPRRGDAQ